jgi:fructose-bisphosphate aldolase class II
MLVNMRKIVKQSYEETYGVLAINCFNLETIRATIRAAEEKRSPIIINLYEEHLQNNITPEIVGGIVKELAKKATVPIALNLDHGKNTTIIQRCLDAGFTSIMIDASEYELGENIQRTKEFVKYAKSYGVCVEAELGHMGDAPTYAIEELDNYLTKPSEVKNFVMETGIDCLAINVGTAHGLYKENTIPHLDFDLLEKIKQEAQIPLVLHGGSGAGKENLREAVQHGVTKINVGAAIFAAGRKALKEMPEEDLSRCMLIMEESYKKEIEKHIDWVGSSNKVEKEIV